MGNLKDEATHIDIDGYLWKDVVFDSEGNAKEGVYLEDTTWLHSYIKELKLKPIEKKEMKEFLVNHDDKWTLQLLDSDTEENSFRVAVPIGAKMLIKHPNCREVWSYSNSKVNPLNTILWQRSETEYLMQCVNGDKLTESISQLKNQDTVKVTIDELKHRVGVEPNTITVDAMREADALFANAVNNPSHYSDSAIECIDAMEAMLSPQEFIGYLRGNMFKYQWRYQKKNGIEDLQKSEWYLKKLIEKEMKNEDQGEDCVSIEW